MRGWGVGLYYGSRTYDPPSRYQFEGREVVFAYLLIIYVHEHFLLIQNEALNGTHSMLRINPPKSESPDGNP